MAVIELEPMMPGPLNFRYFFEPLIAVLPRALTTFSEGAGVSRGLVSKLFEPAFSGL